MFTKPLRERDIEAKVIQCCDNVLDINADFHCSDTHSKAHDIQTLRRRFKEKISRTLKFRRLGSVPEPARVACPP